MKNKKIVSKIIDCILNILIVLFAIFLLISMYTVIQVKVLKNEYANFFGYSLFEVQTGSMHGTIEAGDWIIIKSTKDVKIGDIITYRSGNDYITHRIIESYRGTYVTKGDANNTADEPIDQRQIIGKVAKKLSGFGLLRKTLFNPVVIILLFITLYLFNLTFKTTKSELDIKLEKLLNTIKSKIKLNEKKAKDDEVKVIAEEPITIGSVKEEKVPESIIEVKEEPKEEIIEVKETPKEEIIEEPKEEMTEEEKEEELSKTSMFRVISIKRDKQEVKEEPIVEEEVVEEVVTEEVNEEVKEDTPVEESKEA